MKKLILVLSIAVAYTCSAFAFPVTFFTPEPPEITLKTNLQANILDDVKNEGLGISSIVKFDFDELICDAGVNYVNNQFDFTTQLIYWPKFFDKFYTGFGLTYHFYDYPKMFTEHDFFIDWYLKINFNEYFELYTRYGLFLKTSVIPDVITCQSRTMNFELYLNFFPSEKWCCYGYFNSNSYFDYPLFLTLFFGTGFETEIIEDKISVGMELSTKWYDGIVVALNPGHVAMSMFCKVKIK